MTAFDFDLHKKQTVQRLEALEKIRLDFDNLKTKLKDLNLTALVEQAAQTEITKIMKYAKQHEIPFTIDVKELVGQVQVPSATLTPSNLHPSQTLPFEPALDEYITDKDGDAWVWNATTKSWVLEEEEEENWNSSGCEWQHSNC
jgi:SpoU rRNA methylase family enzyme